MPIDASIISGLKAPQFEFDNPLDRQAKIQNLINQRQQQQSGALGIQQQQQAMADDAAGRQLFSSIQRGGAMPSDAEILGRMGPTHGAAAVKALREADQARATLQKTKGEVGALEADYAGGLASMVKNAGYSPDALQFAIQHAHEAGYEQSAQQMAQLLQPGNQDKVQPFIDGLIKRSPKQQELINAGVNADAAKSRAQSAATEAVNSTSRETRASKMEGPQLAEAKAKATAAQRQNDATLVASAAQQGPGPLAQVLDQLSQDPERFAPFRGVHANTKPSDILKLGLNPDQAITTAQAEKNAAETNRHNLTAESTARLQAAVAAGRLTQEQMVNGMKYGPGTSEYWVKQLQDNPDSIKEMPPELRSVVGKGFTQATGLPLPTPLGATGQTTETAARTALDNISFIRQAIQNPAIQKQLGPIMGRLGNVEQHIGTAVGLTPQEEQLAQELRTRMRYFVFQEGKAVLGGRLPANLMKSLQESSSDVKMDAPMLAGSLDAATGTAQSALDNADRQRFGGKMRTREMRGAGPQTAVDPVVKAYADQYFSGDVTKAQAAIAAQKKAQ